MKNMNVGNIHCDQLARTALERLQQAYRNEFSDPPSKRLKMKKPISKPAKTSSKHDSKKADEAARHELAQRTNLAKRIGILNTSRLQFIAEKRKGNSYSGLYWRAFDFWIGSVAELPDTFVLGRTIDDVRKKLLVHLRNTIKRNVKRAVAVKKRDLIIEWLTLNETPELD